MELYLIFVGKINRQEIKAVSDGLILRKQKRNILQISAWYADSIKNKKGEKES